MRDNMKMKIFEKQDGNYGLNSSGSVYGQMAGSYKHSNDTAVVINLWELLKLSTDWWILMSGVGYQR
jgi:hypothetical protein